MTSRSKSRKAKRAKSQGQSPGSVNSPSTGWSTAPTARPPQQVKAEAPPKATVAPEQVPLSVPEINVAKSKGERCKGLRLNESVGEVVMAGDEFVVTSTDGPVVLGPGLQVQVPLEEDSPDKVVAVIKSGILIHKKPNTFYIDMNARSYLPYKHDDIVGIIMKRAGDQYVVDIGTRDRVTLSKFAFEGATKKNKPELKIGDIVFARFMDLPSDFPFEISCVTTSGKAMGHGPLEGGFLFQIPSPAVKVLQTSKKQGGSDIIKRLGQITAFEMTIGVNGYIWVKTKFHLVDILISRTIEAAGNLPPEEHDQLVSSFRSSFDSVRGILSAK